MLHVLTIPAFKDNYIWLIKETKGTRCTLVDPGDAHAAQQALDKLGLTLDSILITHHHWDHVDGVKMLCEQSPHQVTIYGPAKSQLSFNYNPLKEGDKVELYGAVFEILDTPGHTLDHIAYYGDNKLFCGDTLFSAGCGRLFEGTAKQLADSLHKLAALPSHTQVYCTHEYTQANLTFALQVEPANQQLRLEMKQVAKLIQQGLPSLPSTIEKELAINPFLRTEQALVKAAVQAHTAQPLADPDAVFKALRHWKDSF